MIALLQSGCSSVGYYAGIMNGHLDLINQSEPVEKLIKDSKTPEKLRNMLITSQKIRDFASNSLYLPENDSYREYADLKRPFAVWNVIATREFSVDSEKWCFLFTGCLSYRGYFTETEATEYANSLKAKGLDVYVAGARAYSTLGWFSDPLLNTMMYQAEAYRAGIIFHELAHQEIYIEDDSAFNESFATTVEQEGIRRWFIATEQADKYEKYLKNKKQQQDFNSLLNTTRTQLQALYAKNIPDDQKRQGKADILRVMKKSYQKLKQSWGGDDGYDKWMAQDINNAHLALISTYHEFVPVFKKILASEENDLKKFYAKVKQIGKLKAPQRKAGLAAYGAE